MLFYLKVFHNKSILPLLYVIQKWKQSKSLVGNPLKLNHTFNCYLQITILIIIFEKANLFYHDWNLLYSTDKQTNKPVLKDGFWSHSFFVFNAHYFLPPLPPTTPSYWVGYALTNFSIFQNRNKYFERKLNTTKSSSKISCTLSWTT